MRDRETRRLSDPSPPLSTGRAVGLLFLFVAISLPLSWAWIEWWQRYYVRVLFELLDPLYPVIGLRHSHRGPVPPRLVAVVPFLVLMAITPDLSWRRRTLGSLLGIGLIACFHMLLFVVADAAYMTFGHTKRALTRFFPLVIINDGLPFMIWVFVARDFLRRLVPGLREPT